MPITAEQREARRHHLGSSDMAAILGLDPWKNAHDVYLDKTGALQEWRGNEATELGNELEPVVLRLASKQLGSLIIPDTRTVADCPIISVNTDSLVQASGEPVEAKTNSIVGRSDDEWGEPETDEVPLRVIIQCHAHMMAWEREICHVPALIGRRGFLLYRVCRSETIVSTIKEKALEFMEMVRAAKPPAVAPHLEVAKRIRRQPEKIVAVDPAVAKAVIDSKAALKAAEQTAEAAQSALLAAMRDGDGYAEAATCGEFGAFTYLQQTRKEYTCPASTFRVLRHKKNGL